MSSTIKKKLENFYKEFQSEIEREKIARLGLSFKQKIELSKLRNKILKTLFKKSDEAKSLISKFEEMQAEFIASSEKIEFDLGFLPPIYEQHTTLPTGLNFSNIICPEEPPRYFNMVFHGGLSIGAVAPFISQTVNGRVGWTNNVEQFINDDTNKIKKALFQLSWVLIIPRKGYYNLKGPSEFKVDVGYKLSGSGLWEEDAWLRIWIGSGLHIPGPVKKIRIDTLEVYESKSSGIGSTKERLSKWYDLRDIGQSFHVPEDNTTINFAIIMEIETWAEDGRVRVDVNDFWYPSIDANSDFSVVD